MPVDLTRPAPPPAAHLRGAHASVSATGACAEPGLTSDASTLDEVVQRKDAGLRLGMVWAAIKLSLRNSRQHLLTAWIHVPLGLTFLLFLVWAIKLGLSRAPFRFPAAVLAAFGLFMLLLLLDWLSERFPGKKRADCERQDSEKGARSQQAKHVNQQGKRFVDPILLLLGEPMNFCLRNMSVMFTPSFILIPAREIIPGREIGLIAAWFTISQFMGLVVPVLLNKAIHWTFQRVQYSPVLRRFSPAARRGSIVVVDPASNGRRGSVATLTGMSFEKGVSFDGGQKLGPLATGLAGITANSTALVSYFPVKLNHDELSYLQGAAIEQARQQGDPSVTSKAPAERDLMWRRFHARSDVSTYQHGVHHPRNRSPRATSGQSVGKSRSRSPLRTAENLPSSVDGPTSRESSMAGMRDTAIHGQNDADIDAATTTPAAKEPPMCGSAAKANDENCELSYASAGLRLNGLASAADDIEVIGSPRDGVSHPSGDGSGSSSTKSSRVGSESPSDRKPVEMDDMPGGCPVGKAAQPIGPSGIVKSTDFAKMSTMSLAAATAPVNTSAARGPFSSHVGGTVEEFEEEEDDRTQVERLADVFSDLITPAIYTVLLLVGLVLYYTVDFALCLHLAINILTFLFGITLVPPVVRRFAHPILTCSILTVLILWGLGAAKGLSIKQTLAQYSVDAKYDVLWDPQGYNGPVIGAGDVLFSTLDAGIVSLAMPMYRYRKDLRENFVRMMTVLVPCACLALFFWPWIAWLFGMDEVRSLAFAARFMSTPLAIELANNVGADESITIILVVITGIVFAICKDPFFRLLRVDPDDHLTIGITCGSTSGAIGASSLISRPKVMAVASLAFIMYGTVLLIATAVPPIVEVVQKLSGAL